MQKWTDKHSEIVHAPNPQQLLIEGGGHLFLARQSVWVGEVVYNLRSALDYVIYDFACINHGFRHVANTQFPICDNWAEFEAARTGVTRKGKPSVCRLSHVPEPIIDRLRQLQPCSNPPCEWTRRLRDLSNPDKHRALVGVRITATVLRSDHPALAAVLQPEQRAADEHHFVVGMFFKDTDVDVIDTLKVLQRQVRALIEEFKPAFKRSGGVIKIEYEGRLPFHEAPPST